MEQHYKCVSKGRGCPFSWYFSVFEVNKILSLSFLCLMMHINLSENIMILCSQVITTLS